MRGLAALAFMTALSFPAISPAVAGFLSPLLPGLPIVVEARLVCGKFAGKFSCKHIDDGTVGIEIGGDEKKGSGNNGNGNAAPNPAEQPGGAAGGPINDAPAGGGANPPVNDGGANPDAGGGANPTPATHDCPPDYKVLEVPSKFGFCEPPEGLPNNAYKVCPPGATGTPPACTCPGQSDYGPKGNKCLRWSGACGTDKPGWNNPNFFCKNAEKIDCTILADGKEKCCCKTFD